MFSFVGPAPIVAGPPPGSLTDDLGHSVPVCEIRGNNEVALASHLLAKPGAGTPIFLVKLKIGVAFL
ncbi:MAG: hypothetical protein K0R39_1380 [Symbiobacteriaceae bacterium]|jgi:hypothetical protein|nr:hypothetical protein [Symbiobacteriaceae bacterium]